MGYASSVIDAHIAWFELRARSGAPSRSFTGGLAVLTGITSNTENGLAIDPRSVDVDQFVEALDWIRAADAAASCVLRSPAGASFVERLAGLGVVPDNTGNEMGRSLVGLEPPPAAVAGYEIDEALTGDDLLAGFESAEMSSWFDERDRRLRHVLDMTAGLGPGSPARHWIARSGATAVGMATSFLIDDVVVLLHCGVDEAHRRRGIGNALTGARLRAAIADGAKTAVLSPSDDGYELHRHLGFDLVPAEPDRWFHVGAQP